MSRALRLASRLALGLAAVAATHASASAQHATITITDVTGQPIEGAAVYYDVAGGLPGKIDYNGAPIMLGDLGAKVSLRVQHALLGSHEAGISLKGEGKYRVEMVLTGDDVLTRVRPATTTTTIDPLREALASVAVGVNGSDSCGSAAAIAGSGVFAFDSTGATTDGLPGTGLTCNEGFGNDDVNNDIWYAWTADCDGTAIVDTCGSSFDTRLGAYENVACPPGNANLLDCNDDSCDLQSSISFAVTSGTTYLIRVGSFSATPGAGGDGTLSVLCDGSVTPVGCTAATFCQDPDLLGGIGSNLPGGLGFFTHAENLSASADGDITEVCWWGIATEPECMTVTDFVITYYNNDAGGSCPGSIKAGPFNVTSNTGTTGNLFLGVFPETVHTASHAPVAVAAGECYWIEILNADPTCRFFWESSSGGDGRGCNTLHGDLPEVQELDVAVCTNVDFGTCEVTVPPNDLCENATPLSGEGTFAFDNLGASSDGPTHAACDFFDDGGDTDHDVWYCWTADTTGDVLFETCGQTTVDTRINVYAGCGPATDANLIACNGDGCGFQSSLVLSAVSGESYKLRLGTFPGALGGPGAFTVTSMFPPPNDLCEAATPVSVPATLSGSTAMATLDEDAPDCGVSITAPGVWYRVDGTGTTITASTCQNTNFDTKLSVYCGGCFPQDDLVCAGVNDDACSFQSEVSWCSQLGVEYLVLVHGFGSATGDFELNLTADGARCSDAPQCLPVGACCVGPDLESCLLVDALACFSMGGNYQGDGTNCNEYKEFACADTFHDITDTGTELVLGDDAGQVVPLGFDFTFFEVPHNSIAVCSNGYLTFGSTLTAFSETFIPDTEEPNDMIAPLWNDFSPNQGGSIHYQTTGPAGNRCFIAQWTDVPQFNQGDANTFQALLFEFSSEIQFRYGNISVDGTGPPNGVVGIENADGTRGESIFGVAPGTCKLLSPRAQCPPSECALVFGTGEGDATFQMDGFVWNTQLDGVFASYPVWLDDIPQFQIPPFANLPRRWGNLRPFMIEDVPFQTYSVQVVMWNPDIFPTNPEQYSDVMHVTIWLSGRVTVQHVGSADNMTIDYEVTGTPEGLNYLRFPFTIEGF